MEEIKHKVDTKNAPLILNAVNKLVDTILTKASGGLTNSRLIEELSLLKEYCGSADAVTNVTACQGLVSLLEHRCLNRKQTFVTLIAAIPSAKNVSGIINSIFHLMLVDMNRTEDSNRSYYPIRGAEHPLISVLKLRRDAWRCILNHMEILVTQADKEVRKTHVELLQSVFVYILCDPEPFLPQSCRQATWQLALDTLPWKLLFEIVAWQQWDSPEHISQLSRIMCHLSVTPTNSDEVAVCCVMLASVVHLSLLAGHDPSLPLNHLRARLLLPSTKHMQSVHSALLIILAYAIGDCPAPFLLQLIRFCDQLAEEGECCPESVWLVATALVPWLAQSSPLIDPRVTKEANSILSLARSLPATTRSVPYSSWFDNPLLPLATAATRIVNRAVSHLMLFKNLQRDSSITESWLRELDKTRICGLELLLGSLLVSNSGQESLRLAILAATDPHLTSYAHLSVLLHQLANERSPSVQLALLRAIVSTARNKLNMAMVVGTLEAMTVLPEGRIVALGLYMRLWQVEPRCYSYLHGLLMPPTPDTKSTFQWELSVAQAVTICHICDKQPEKHGQELVTLLSSLLSRCNKDSGRVASALALRALASLCTFGIVDTGTVWRLLAPRLAMETRAPVLVSLCSVFGSLPEQRNSSLYDKMLADMLPRLWNFVMEGRKKEIIAAAFQALAKFKLSEISLDCLPIKYRIDLKTSVDDMPKDIFVYIPGECWVQLLQKVDPVGRAAACDLLFTWLTSEMDEYHSSIYIIVNEREPQNYAHLHPRSLVRALATFPLRLSATLSTADESDISTAALCLSILSRPTIKPLPPINWSRLAPFLEHSHHDINRSALHIVAKQALLSPSTMALLDSFVADAHLSENKTCLLYEALEEFGSSLPSDIMCPFIEKTFFPAFEKTGASEGDGLLLALLQYTKAALRKSEMQDTIRSTLEQQVQAIWEKLEPESTCMGNCIECAVELTANLLDEVSRIASSWDFSADKLRKCVMLRCVAALDERSATPFVWLNDLVEGGFNYLTEQEFILGQMGNVLKERHYHPTAPSWLAELMGRLLAVHDQVKLDFLCRVFVLSVDVLSRHELSDFHRENILIRFPQALSTVSVRYSLSNKVVNWICDFRNKQTLSPLYTTAFYNASLSLRHNEAFKDVWRTMIF